MITNVLTLLSMMAPEAVVTLLEVVKNPKTVELLSVTANMFIDSSGKFQKEELRKEIDRVKTSSGYSW